MIKHIVMWKVEAHEGHGTKIEVMQKMKEQLEALEGEIGGLNAIEVGINFNESESAYDVILYSILKNKAALEGYQKHPKHLAVGEYVKQVATHRAVVDYEM